ncbi:MAG: type I restriction endonuclease subunit R [Candidatus Methanomethylophilaceae archaeon]|nr:type I restriction endonuclease subunit R [Candidatus Methanomethylophilaceae archaeon]MBR6038191.1 type I restriction endonuclease subunit R [Candidatus Methanomethylophilaceae archaeon]
MSTYNVVAATDEFTVVSEYVPVKKRSDAYQSEAALEEQFIKDLESQGYEYILIDSEEALKANLRRQLERLNGITFTDQEWERFFGTFICSANEGIVEKTRRIQKDHVQSFVRDDGSTKNIRLIDKRDIHSNSLQVINQYVAPDGIHANRYDVTVLVNGLPLVHVELKRRGVDIREAFNQINRYQEESFWSGSGLYEYVQIFVISNGTYTKYYSNTTRFNHVSEQTRSVKPGSKRTSNSFEFTSYWADGSNRIIPDLLDFTRTFFARHSLLSVLTRYCVFDCDDRLLVMRPYQIVATERILNRILVSTNYKRMGTLDAGGYIWHTTGSGKTLTSFKTAQLASQLPYIDKVLFVVDRQDLDYQTVKEYDRFEKGAADANRNTAVLERNLSDPSKRILVTTIQKLEVFVKRNKGHEIYSKHVVLIFDECHRSQFGEMHRLITKAFRNYHIFGFTGTPIFAVNASSGTDPTLRTTADAFGDRLHSYTIVNAINDGNVLPFLVTYISTVKAADDIQDSEVSGIETENIMGCPERISLVTRYILDHFDQKTKRSASYDHRGRKVSGFNSIFAVSSIPMAMKYYAEFRRQLEASGRDLKVAVIYTSQKNGDDCSEGIEVGEMDLEGMTFSERQFLDKAIGEYNLMFHSNFDSSSDGFQNYYKDVSHRMKNRDLDLLIVVNMFLTGFDATTLNTLWVDKSLRSHGLIQAFSRTNRILNSVKTCGNIVCFRKMSKAVNDAISLFGDENAAGTVLLRTYRDYYDGYVDDEGVRNEGYSEKVGKLKDEFPLDEEIVGEEASKKFVRLFGSILRLVNILSAFDQFQGEELLSPREMQDYQSRYLDIYRRIRVVKAKEDVSADIVFEIELVKQVEVNIDYILDMVEKNHAENCRDGEVRGDIEKAIGSSTQLWSKKALIMAFIDGVNDSTDVRGDWEAFVEARRERDLEEIIAKFRLQPEGAREFARNSLRDGYVRTTGTDIDRIMPKLSRFGGGRAEQKEKIVAALKEYFDTYYGT